MKFSNVAVFCVSLTVLCTSDAPHPAIQIVKAKALKSYHCAVECGKEYLRKVGAALKEGKVVLSNKFTEMASRIRRDKTEDTVVPIEEHKDGEASEEMENLTPEEVDRLIEEIKKKLAGFLGNGNGDEEVGEKEEEAKKDEEKKMEGNQEL